MRFNELFKRYRMALGLRHIDVAKAAGVSRPAIGDLEAGKIPRQLIWRRAIKAVGLEADKFLGAMSEEERKRALSESKQGLRNKDLMSENPPPVRVLNKDGKAVLTSAAEWLLQPRWIPVYAGPDGGDGRFKMVSNEQEDCPIELAGVARPYFVEMPDTSMTPLIRNGWLAAVSPEAPIAPGDTVVAILPDGGHAIKQFVRREDGKIVLARLVPYREMEIEDDEDDETVRMHKVVKRQKRNA